MLVIKVFSSLKSVGSHYQQFIIFVVSRLRLVEHPWDRSKVALITSLLYYPKKFSNKLVFSRTTFLQLVDLLVNIHSKFFQKSDPLTRLKYFGRSLYIRYISRLTVPFSQIYEPLNAKRGIIGVFHHLIRRRGTFFPLPLDHFGMEFVDAAWKVGGTPSNNKGRKLGNIIEIISTVSQTQSLRKTRMGRTRGEHPQ